MQHVILEILTYMLLDQEYLHMPAVAYRCLWVACGACDRLGSWNVYTDVING